MVCSIPASRLAGDRDTSSAGTLLGIAAVRIGRTASGLFDTGMIADGHASSRTGHGNALVAGTPLRRRTPTVTRTTAGHRHTRMIAGRLTRPTGHRHTPVPRTPLRRRTRTVRTTPARYRNTGTVRTRLPGSTRHIRTRIRRSRITRRTIPGPRRTVTRPARTIPATRTRHARTRVNVILHTRPAAHRIPGIAVTASPGTIPVGRTRYTGAWIVLNTAGSTP